MARSAKVDGNMEYKDVTMPYVSQKDGFIISPYFDYLSFFFNKAWRHPAGDILSIMIKLADSNKGDISNGKIRKTLSELDKEKLNEAAEICKDIRLFGVKCGNGFCIETKIKKFAKSLVIPAQAGIQF